SRFPPWGAVRLAALVVALVTLTRAVVHPAGPRVLRGTGHARLAEPAPPVLLSAFYLGWEAQAGFLQQAHRYVHVPAVLLAIAVVVWWLASLRSRPVKLVGTAGLLAVLAWAGVTSPLADGRRLALWGRCWRERSTPAVRDRLALTQSPSTPG